MAAEDEELDGDALHLAEHEDVAVGLIDFKEEPHDEPFHVDQLQNEDEEDLEPPSAVTKHAYRIGLSGTESKAGLEGVDKARVNKIIYEKSKNSSFFRNEQRKEAEMERRIAHMKERLATLKDDPTVLSSVETRVAKLESERDLSQTMIHVDMDAFYAAVEMRDDPSLVGKPMAVGGMSMLSTSNYEARKFGVRSAMPGFIALELCPQLIIVPHHFEKYKEASKQTRTVYAIFDPNYMMASLDEAYLNITSYLHAHPDSSPLSVANEIQQRIFALTKLTCSIGIGPNKMLAKICTDMRKPNGIFQLVSERAAILDFLRPLAVRKISGIGKVTEKMLTAIGIHTCGEMFDRRALLFQIFHESSAQFFLRASLGISSSQIVHRDRKSVSVERTFQGLSDNVVILNKCLDIATKLSTTMREKELLGKTLTVKLKATTFAVKTKSVTLAKSTNDAQQIFKAASELLQSEFPTSIRLLGVRMSTLSRVGEQEKEACDARQKRIDVLFQQHRSLVTSPPAPAAAASLTPCPVCQRTDFQNEASLLAHVEKCLESPTSKTKRSSSATTQPSKKGKAAAPGQKTIMDFLK